MRVQCSCPCPCPCPCLGIVSVALWRAEPHQNEKRGRADGGWCARRREQGDFLKGFQQRQSVRVGKLHRNQQTLCAGTTMKGLPSLIRSPKEGTTDHLFKDGEALGEPGSVVSLSRVGQPHKCTTKEMQQVRENINARGMHVAIKAQPEDITQELGGPTQVIVH